MKGVENRGQYSAASNSLSSGKNPLNQEFMDYLLVLRTFIKSEHAPAKVRISR
jgi:hypothetical protein